jgi:hypothetical protein
VGLLADRLPDPPDNHCNQDPRHQRPKEQQHDQHHQGRDGSALGECLRLIGHIAPAGDEGHRFREGEPSKTPAESMRDPHNGHNPVPQATMDASDQFK